MSSPPKLTVAILTYNRKTYLWEALKSLALQTFKDFDVIIFDNASDYPVEECIAAFPDLAIRVDTNSANIGNLANFEKVISYSFKSKYVMMFHDDDTMHPVYLERCISFLELNPKAICAGSTVTFMSPGKDMFLFKKTDSASDFTEYSQEQILPQFIQGLDLGFGSVIYRTTAFLTTKARIAEFDKWFDRPFIVDMLHGGTIGITHGNYINYRLHPGQDSQSFHVSSLVYVMNLFNYYFSHMQNKESCRTKQLFSDTAINTAFHSSQTMREFRYIVSVFRKQNLFSYLHIGPRGIYYACAFIFKYLRRLVTK